MSDGWKEFLLEQGAVCGERGVRDFGNPAAERRAARGGNVLVDLSHFAFIRAHGPDAAAFLNGQLTNDIGAVDATRSQLSAWCSPKGRMLVVFRVLRHGDGYLLQLPAALREDIARRLRMYVLRAKVTLESADDAFVRFGIAGPEAASLLQAASVTAPADNDRVASSGRFTVLRLPGAHPRFEILAPPADAPGLWSELNRSAVPAGADAWTWHDIAAGIPMVLPETSDAFVPQMANLELVGGVSFSKGCYTGQEIVARLHYRGRLKQRMYRAHAVTERTPAPGERIYAPASPDQATGTVVVAAPSAAGSQDLLAVIHCDSAANGELRLGAPDGPPLRIEPLPYLLTLPE